MPDGHHGDQAPFSGGEHIPQAVSGPGLDGSGHPAAAQSPVPSGQQDVFHSGADTVIYLSGLAGHGKAHDSAVKSAKVLNQLHPYMMILTTVAVVPNTELYNEVQRGEFVEVDERERLEEFKALLSGLDNEMIVFSAASTNSMPFVAQFTGEREKLLRAIDGTIRSMTDEQAARIRASRRRMTLV